MSFLLQSLLRLISSNLSDLTCLVSQFRLKGPKLFYTLSMIQADNASVLLVFRYLSACSVPKSYSLAPLKEAEATLIEKRQF
jgi:hypothetical protein